MGIQARANNPDLPNKDQLTKTYLEQISKRERGQESFAFASRGSSLEFGSPATRSPNMTKSTSREIQEADVFKLGDEGKKELFLLNRYRGFQVISFEKGVDRPEIKGRFPVYNNWRSEMYYLKDKKTALILNTEYDGQSRRYYSSSYKTVVYAIDVKDSSNPRLVDTYSLSGSLSNSRMVGDVLYLISETGSYQERKAKITSIEIDAKSDVMSIDRKNLTSDGRYVRTMNTLQIGEKYYVLVSSTNWRNPSDRINVFDITSSKGKIDKVLTAQAKGRITERSQAFIHKDYLFMVSNYQASGSNRNRIWKIAVEAVALKSSKEIVRAESKRTITIGDANGLSAQLEDVRLSGDLLYTFWVPVNRIDPFDLFDISNPERGISHQGQLQFPGWISKAFPIDYKGEKYVLGLGGVVPSVNNDSNKRYPQAKLFKIEKTNKGYKHSEVDTLTIKDENVWFNLNQEDKYFEFMSSEEGQYQILFPVYFGKFQRQGAQLVDVDMEQLSLDAGNKIVGSQSWLKRVFLNKEIGLINAFNDRSLESFDKAKTKRNGIALTTSILELARNIISYKELESGEAIQVVRKNSNSVEFRLINSETPDAELNSVKKVVKVAGEYEWHQIVNNRIYVLTSFNEKVKIEGRYPYTYERKSHYRLTEVNTKDFSVLEKLEQFNIKYSSKDYEYKSSSFVKVDNGVLLKIGDQLALIKNGSIRELRVEKSCQYFFETTGHLSLYQYGSDFYAYNAFKVEVSEENRKDAYYFPFFKRLKLKKDKIRCSASINIPGTPITMKSGHLITEDGSKVGRFLPRGRSISYDYSRITSPYYGKRNNKTVSLKVRRGSGKATITDVINTDLTGKAYGDFLITYNGSDSQHRLEFWDVDSSGRFYSRSSFLPGYVSNTRMITVVEGDDNDAYVVIKNSKLLDFYKVDKNEEVTRLKVTSEFDTRPKDGSAEFIFGFRDITKAGDKFIISQGNYGVTEVTLE